MRFRPLAPALLVALATAFPPPAAAERLARCRRSCGLAVDACIAASPLRYRRARTVCRNKLHRSCRRLGIGACNVTPPTTQPPATLPPATLPPTTTTTLPSVRNYSGTWKFFGSLTSDTCGSSYYLSDTFFVTQAGTQLGGSIGSIPGSAMVGQVTPTGFELGVSGYVSGCLVVIALVANNDGTVVLTAGTGYDITCGSVTCRSIWVGTLSR